MKLNAESNKVSINTTQNATVNFYNFHINDVKQLNSEMNK